MQLAMTYIAILQVTAAQWVALRPIFEVFTGEKGYERGGLSREAWWCKEVAENQRRATLEEILKESKMRRS